MSIVVMGAVFVDIKGYPLSSYIPTVETSSPNSLGR